VVGTSRFDEEVFSGGASLSSCHRSHSEQMTVVGSSGGVTNPWELCPKMTHHLITD